MPRMAGIPAAITVNKLMPKTPTNAAICITSMFVDQIYPIKFQGNPVNKFPLRNSKIEKIKEKNKTKKIFFSASGPTIKIVIPKKRDKNNGISIAAKGINPLNISS